jgi:ABC-type taurine transport system ATPase subunit
MVSNTIENQPMKTVCYLNYPVLPWRANAQNLSFTFQLSGVDLLSLSNGRAETENKMLRQISGATREERKLCNLHSLLNMVRIG